MCGRYAGRLIGALVFAAKDREPRAGGATCRKGDCVTAGASEQKCNACVAKGRPVWVPRARSTEVVMVNWSDPQQVNCPHYGKSQAELLPAAGDRADYRCPTCGEFSISGTQEKRFAEGRESPQDAQFVVRGDGLRFLQPAFP